MPNAVQDLRLALRTLSRQPGFAFGVVVALALAIGASTAIFSFVNTLLIKPFPFRDPGRLVEIRTVRGGEMGKLSMAEVEDLGRDVPSIESIAAHTGSAGGYNFSGEGRPEEWKAILTTGNLFEVLGTPLVAGAPWPKDMDRDRGYRVILSHGVWKSAFGGRSDIAGRTIALDHAPGYQIHGVAPEGFDFPRGVQVFRSLGGFASYDRRDSRNVVAIARMAEGRTLAQLQTEIDGFSRRMSELYPDQNRDLRFQAYSFRDLYSGGVKPYLLVLMGAVGLVLLMACLNAANLLLARALGRRRELAVRLALGAGRAAILWQQVVEGLVLASLAAGAGLLLAQWWMSALRGLIGDRLPAWMTVALDARVLFFAIGVAIAASLASVLLPAAHSLRRVDLASRLREGGRGSSGGRGTGLLRAGLIVAQVALAVILLAGAGLLIRGFVALENRDKGFDASSVSTFRVALGWRRYGGERIERYYERAQRDLAAVPGVQSVAFGHAPPLTGQETSRNNTVLAAGQSIEEGQRNPYVALQPVSENYFEFLRIAVKSGRVFNSFDRRDSAPVAIVSQRLAERLWPSENAVGRRVALNPSAQTAPVFREVVGVVASVERDRLGGAGSMDVFLPYRQSSEANHYLLARTSLPAREFQALAERALWGIDPEQSLFDFRSYEDRLRDGVWQLRLSQSILLVFGGVALALAGIGLYGLMSYLVAMQRRELGVRLALGAAPGMVRWLIVRRGARLAVVGIVVGVGGAFGFGLFLRAQIAEVPSVDPLALLLAALVVWLAAALASAIPAWRASRIDPLIALREE